VKPVLIDAFCCAGGATKGYQRAGFYVVGVDHRPQPRYCGDEFHQTGALEFLAGKGMSEAVAIHASPPCQASSSLRRLNPGKVYVNLIPETRAALEASGLPYVIENVVGSELRDPAKLCGSAFGLPLRRHRLFETNWPLMVPRCQHGVERPRFPVGRGSPTRTSADRSCVSYVYGSTRYKGDLADRKAAMDIDWMTNAELTQAIPPAYTELIGHQLMAVVLADKATAA
jgi:hypothetical protein